MHCGRSFSHKSNKKDNKYPLKTHATKNGFIYPSNMKCHHSDAAAMS